MAMVSCARPSSYEPFVVREKAEYGDTYIFNLDLSDSTVSYGLDFYTRLERPAFGTFPADSISRMLSEYQAAAAFDLIQHRGCLWLKKAGESFVLREFSKFIVSHSPFL